MFHLTSPPRWLAAPRQPCLCDVSLRAPAGSCSLTACTVCPAGSRTRETKRLQHKAAELRSGVAGTTAGPPSRQGRSAASPGGTTRGATRAPARPHRTLQEGPSAGRTQNAALSHQAGLSGGALWEKLVRLCLSFGKIHFHSPASSPLSLTCT